MSLQGARVIFTIECENDGTKKTYSGIVFEHKLVPDGRAHIIKMQGRVAGPSGIPRQAVNDEVRVTRLEKKVASIEEALAKESQRTSESIIWNRDSTNQRLYSIEQRLIALEEKLTVTAKKGKR